MKNCMKIMAFIGVLVSSVSLRAMNPRESVITSIEGPADTEVLLITTLDPMTTGRIGRGNLRQLDILNSVFVETAGVKSKLPKEIPVFTPGTSLRLKVVVNEKVSYPKTDNLGPKNTLVAAEDGSVSFKADR